MDLLVTKKKRQLSPLTLPRKKLTKEMILKPSLELSPVQANIVNGIKNGVTRIKEGGKDGKLIRVEAVAGSGKTKTILVEKKTLLLRF